MSYEINFDGLIGPTHNYSGLSLGNIASTTHKEQLSNPKQAALQGLEKMKFLMDLGIKQAILPPHERPHIPSLRALGFVGADRNLPGIVYKAFPHLLHYFCSAAPMWAANAATVTPSVDSVDQHVHFTPANLSSMLHRSIEPVTTGKILKAIFPDKLYFTHHPSLPQGSILSDEGAANNTRFCGDYTQMGVNLFVYGKHALEEGAAPLKFPARQTFEATSCITRSHQIYPQRLVLAQQHPEAIDAGVFHNDVAAVSNKNVFLYHEKAFLKQKQVIEELVKKCESALDTPLKMIEVADSVIPIGVAVNTYLFNSQIITLPDETMAMISPIECQNNEAVKTFLEEMIRNEQNPIRDIHYVDLTESMNNGGGPACLRLRVVLNQKELEATNQGVFLTENLYARLVVWINKHYREKLLPKDLADPLLVDESQAALHELTQILHLGNIYEFQK